MRRHLCLALLALGAPALSAQTPRATPCDSAESMVDMENCSDAALHAADSLLNIYYQAARRAATAPSSLRRAESAWITFRDVTCNAEADEYRGGTMASLVPSVCRVRLTKQRTHDLWAVYLQDDNLLPEPSP